MPNIPVLNNPAWMSIINAIGVIYGGLESTGVINLLGTNKYGAYAILALTAVNSIAHAISPPTPGPLAPGK